MLCATEGSPESVATTADVLGWSAIRSDLAEADAAEMQGPTKDSVCTVTFGQPRTFKPVYTQILDTITVGGGLNQSERVEGVGGRVTDICV